MEYTVPALSIVTISFAALCGIAIPTLLYLYFRKRRHADVLPFWVGCAVFLVFALVLEKIAYVFFMKLSVWTAIQSNIWLYAVVAGLFAGVFEETGRFAAFTTLLRRKRDKNVNALMYGAGHGGFEAFYLLLFAMTTNLVYAVLMNMGRTDLLTAGIADEATRQTVEAGFQVLSTTAPSLFLVSVVERIGAVALHISLSVLVWFAAAGGKKFWLFPLAILLHALVDAAAVTMSRYIANYWLIEAAIYALSGLCVILAVIVWKKNTSDRAKAA
jgi:uncharacterized membrane protein YhfC